MPLTLVPPNMIASQVALAPALAGLPSRAGIIHPPINGNQIIPLGLFPVWRARHLASVPNTLGLQTRGAILSGGPAPFTPFSDLSDFIHDVCQWGGYTGIWGRVIQQNHPAHITRQFQNALHSLAGPNPAATALADINRIIGLGRTSFASKHLRFIRPDICPVLDSLLSRDLGYTMNPVGYQQFSNDCVSIAGHLSGAGIGGITWGAADVEMSVFACLHF